MRLKLALFSAGVIAISFGAYLTRPYSVVSDTGYQALSARQYVDHYASRFNVVRLVDPHDLSKDVETPLMAWAPFWTYLFVLTFKAGLSVGTAGRVLALLISLIGAAGWVSVACAMGLKRGWLIAAVLLASLYCVRAETMFKTGTGDQAVYALAPWLMLAAIPLSVPLRGRPQSRLVVQTGLFCVALGGVYWIKYSGIFLSAAILLALLREQFRGFNPTRAPALLLTLALYGIAFVTPPLGLKAFNYHKTGSDFLEFSAHSSPPRNVSRMAKLVRQTLYGASVTLFSADQAADAWAGDENSLSGWLIRVPGMLLLGTFLYWMFRYPETYLRNLAILVLAIPLLAFPALSFVGPQFGYAFARCCAPYWILAEFWILALLSSSPKGMRIGLGLLTGIQLVLMAWIPYVTVREAWKFARSPGYRAGAANLFVTDLSKYGTREIDERVKSLIRSPQDVVVAAVYSNRAFGTDTWLELGGRLLVLNTFPAPLVLTHQWDGADYYSTKPFSSSRPVRVILVASDPYLRSDFQESVSRIKGRFPQAGPWTAGPSDPDGRVSIWTSEVQ